MSVAFVTGSEGRLGKMWSMALIDAGYDVCGFDIARDADRAVDVRSIPDLTMRLSFCDPAPSVLVNAAGIDAPPGSNVGENVWDPQTLTWEQNLDQVLAVNYTGTANACAVVGEAMVRAGRGSIINIGSLYASLAPDPRIYPEGWDKPAVYGASKAAVLQLTRHLAVRWARFGVRVNCLSPGGVRGAQSEDFIRRYSERVPMGRMAEPEDLVGPLLFLASDASRYVTGQNIIVDGGYSAW